MKNFIKPAMLAATALISFTPALADPGDVLTIDIQRLFAESAAGKSGTAQLKAKYDAQIATRNAAFNSAATGYNGQIEAARKIAKPNTPLPPATQQSLQQAGERAQAARDQLDQLDQEVTGVGRYVQQQIIERATPLAEQIRAERKAAVVIPKGSALAVDPASDITTALLQRLDPAFPTPSIVLPQQGAPAAPRPAAAAPQGR